MVTATETIREFLDIFSFLKDEPVILYGTGQYTQQLLRAPVEFRIVGLMDSRKTGTVCYGLPVLSEDEVRRSGCKTVILIANLSNAPLIYRRIRAFAKECGITVYYMNGRIPDEKELILPSDWARSVEEILDKALEYDVVSFDLFDTLIARKCLLPKEVFAIAARRAAERGIGPEDFPARRMEAEKALYHGGQPWYTLEDIYAWLAKECRIAPDIADQLKRLELDAEAEMIYPRADMVRCYRDLLKAGKRAVITSDMYLTGEQLKPLLQRCGIEHTELYVSNERDASKYRGTLFQMLREAFPGKKILHIGDNPFSDVERAREKGIDALLIPGAAAWLDVCVLPHTGAAGNLFHELFAQRCFSSAFAADSGGGKIQITDPKDVGYLFFGPLAVGYLAWLAEQISKQNIGRLLFISRDGYLFYRLYRRIQEIYEGLPKADYFLTSRRCASVSALENSDDIRFIFEDICFNTNMPFGSMLEKAFGISADPKDSCAGKTLGELGKKQAWNGLQRYKDPILAHAESERKGYLRYIDALDISEERIGMMNFVGRGVTQKCLQSLIGERKKLIGFYFALEYEAAHILGGAEDSAFSWYSDVFSAHTGRRKLAEQMLQGETIFSAPHGAVLAFEKQGKPIYDTTSGVRAGLVQACQHGILEYLEDVLALKGGLRGLADAVDAADAIFGLLCDNRFQLSDEIRNGFQFEDRF